MAMIKCKMCGGDLQLVAGSSIAVCEYCGTKQTVPIADSEKKLTMFARAGRLLRGCEFDKAAGVYESIVAEFPEEAEAYWGLVLCKYGIEYVDDPATAKKVPTCHRSSFDSVMDDGNLEQALENADAVARKVYREEAKQIEELRKGIIEVSGKEEPYDIFICYKETAENGERTIDSVIAQDVYNALTEKGYRTFFSRITLEDKLGQEYESYIFAALHSAKVMLVFGTDYEYFDAVWVKNEWSRFLQLIAAGEKKTLIPCYKGIDAYDMPKEFARLQAQDMGKVGAMQDLLRGIDKLIAAPEKEAPATAGGTDIIGTTLKKAYEFLSVEDWDSAKKCLDTVLGYDPHNVSALIGCLMYKLRVPQEKKLADCSILLEKEEYYNQTVQFADKETKARLEEYNRSAVYNAAMNSAGDLSTAIQYLESIAGWGDADEQLARLKQKQKKRKSLLKSIAAIVVVVALIAAYFAAGAMQEKAVNDLYAGNLSAKEAYKKISSLEWRTKPDEATKYLIARNVNGVYPETLGLTKLVIPAGVTAIGDGVFASCKELTSVTIPGSVISIGERAFSNCKGLTSITIPTSVTSIGKDAFSNCTGLTSITIPNSVTNIGGFSSCTGLSSVIIPDGITSIDGFAFSNCEGLTSITIPDSVTSIGEKAFAGCKNLTSVTIPDSVTGIGASAFLGCRSLTTLTIPASVTVISDSAFSGCERLTSVTIPDSVTRIEDLAFSDCTRLKSVTIPDRVNSIGNRAFNDCKSLTSVTIPNSVIVIGNSVFAGCDSLKVYCEVTKKPNDWALRWSGIDGSNIFWGGK